ncbi:MAG: hypothetical protein AB8G16_13505 [Gammaproteobacteria bacterium]
MIAVHQIALVFHIVVGAAALFVFWVPVVARKGGPLHKKAGRWFVWGMTAVAVTGVVLSTMVLIDPVHIRTGGRTLPMVEAFDIAERARTFSLFLLMLSVLVYTSARHAVLVLKARMDRSILRSPLHVASMVMTGVLALITGYVGFKNDELLLMIFCVIGTSGSITTLRYTFKTQLRNKEWIIEHIGSTIGCGIAAYTAFFAFGGRALLGQFLVGAWQVVPWVLPTIIGTYFSRRMVRTYSKKFALV